MPGAITVMTVPHYKTLVVKYDFSPLIVRTHHPGPTRLYIRSAITNCIYNLEAESPFKSSFYVRHMSGTVARKPPRKLDPSQVNSKHVLDARRRFRAYDQLLRANNPSSLLGRYSFQIRRSCLSVNGTSSFLPRFITAERTLWGSSSVFPLRMTSPFLISTL